MTSSPPSRPGGFSISPRGWPFQLRTKGPKRHGRSLCSPHNIPQFCPPHVSDRPHSIRQLTLNPQNEGIWGSSRPAPQLQAWAFMALYCTPMRRYTHLIQMDGVEPEINHTPFKVFAHLTCTSGKLFRTARMWLLARRRLMWFIARIMIKKEYKC